MTNIEEHLHIGLENVLMVESKICLIDGEAGKLFYRGYNINDLARNSTYEEVAYLLLIGKLPTDRELADFKERLVSERELPAQFMATIESFPRDTDLMDGLRTAVSLLGVYSCCGGGCQSLEKNLDWGISLTAKFPSIVAAMYRLGKGARPVPPDPRLSHAGNFLYMLHGRVPDDVATKAMDMDFVLHAEHGLAASTVAARVTVSTLSDIFSGMTSAIGALKGPLHGGAAGEAFEMLKNIGSVGNVENYVRETLARDGRIMGFGHRVYKITDPRAIHLRQEAKQLAEKTGNTRYFSIAQKLEEVVIPLMKEKRVYPNVDFYSGIVYDGLGVPDSLFNSIFAIGRIPGWVAHTLEQLHDNKLIRPREKYTGQRDLPYIPISKRK